MPDSIDRRDFLLRAAGVGSALGLVAGGVALVRGGDAAGPAAGTAGRAGAGARGVASGRSMAGGATAAGGASTAGGDAIASGAAGSTFAGPPIRGQVIKRGASGFAQAAHVYNERFDSVLPSLVARPLDTADVRTAVNWGVAHDVPLRARSGGHSYAGYSTLSGGMVLDLRNLRGVTDQHPRRHGDDRRRLSADRRVRRPRGPRADDPRRLLPVGRHRRPRAGRRHGPGRPEVRPHRRQPLERADRHRRRPPAHRQRPPEPRPLLGAARRRRRELRRRDELHLPHPSGADDGRLVHPPLARLARRRRARRLAGMGSPRPPRADLDLPPERRRHRAGAGHRPVLRPLPRPARAARVAHLDWSEHRAHRRPRLPRRRS